MIGALGACFGRVVTLDSPKARPPGDFNWGATLWHEMAHVITLQLSNQRIPRWLTEGISVFEEKRARPEWGREMELPFARAMEAGEVLKLRDLNAGFQNPRTISLAYYEASLLVEHIVAEARRTGAARAGASRSPTASTPKRRSRRCCRATSTRCRASFDGFLDQRFGALRRALEVPDGFAPDLPRRQAAGRGRGSIPAAIAVQMALGRALRASDPAGAIAGVRARRDAGADDHRSRKAPTCRSSRWRWRAATRRRPREALEQ